MVFKYIRYIFQAKKLFYTSFWQNNYLYYPFSGGYAFILRLMEERNVVFENQWLHLSIKTNYFTVSCNRCPLILFFQILLQRKYIDSCNSTSTKWQYNQDVATACQTLNKTIHIVFVTGLDMLQVLYKNIFCAMCHIVSVLLMLVK